MKQFAILLLSTVGCFAQSQTLSFTKSDTATHSLPMQFYVINAITCNSQHPQEVIIYAGWIGIDPPMVPNPTPSLDLQNISPIHLFIGENGSVTLPANGVPYASGGFVAPYVQLVNAGVRTSCFITWSRTVASPPSN